MKLLNDVPIKQTCEQGHNSDWIFEYYLWEGHALILPQFIFQSQYSYTVVEALMTHLDDHSKSSPKTRTSIADTLSKIISIAAGESVGKFTKVVKLYPPNVNLFL